VLILLSMAAYGICMPMDSFCVSGRCGDWPSWSVLLLGWLETLSIRDVGPFVAVSWYANGLLFLSWAGFWMQNRRWSAICGAGAAAASLSFLLGKNVVSNEGGVAAPITGVAAGYWLWVGSALLALLSGLYRGHREAALSGRGHR